MEMNMKFGKLILKEGYVDMKYGLYAKKEFIDISDILMKNLMDKVELLLSLNDKLHNLKGELLLKNNNGLYKFYVGENCLDDLLWESVDKEIGFQMSVIEEYIEDGAK